MIYHANEYSVGRTRGWEQRCHKVEILNRSDRFLDFLVICRRYLNSRDPIKTSFSSTGIAYGTDGLSQPVPRRKSPPGKMKTRGAIDRRDSVGKIFFPVENPRDKVKDKGKGERHRTRSFHFRSSRPPSFLLSVISVPRCDDYLSGTIIRWTLAKVFSLRPRAIVSSQNAHVPSNRFTFSLYGRVSKSKEVNYCQSLLLVEGKKILAK